MYQLPARAGLADPIPKGRRQAAPRRSPPARSLATQWVLRVIMSVAAASSSAHDFRVGDVVIDHPYALPSIPGSSNAAMYLRTLKNTGDQADRLLGARTPAAASVEIHHMRTDAGQVARMRAVDAVPMPPRSAQKLMHGGQWHLMLLNLKAPLKNGDHFPVTLRFERAGDKEVTVWVQQPRAAASTAKHAH